MRRILGIFLSVVLLIGTCGCGINGNENEVSVWTASANTKVLRGETYDMSSCSFKISAFQNESESAQIIISPKADVKNYSITLNDLSGADGTKLLKENFSVYNQKYILVEQIIDININAKGGWYPDALLPFEKAVEYKENKVKGGENQGMYITLKVPADQPAGNYTGNFIVTVDGKNHTVPVKVTVYDYLLSTATNVKTSYAIIEKEMAYGELDSTTEMIEAYYNFLLDYRVSAQDLPHGIKGILTDEKLDAWVECAVKYAQDERVSHYNMIYEVTTISNDSYVNKAGEVVPYSGSMVNVNKMEKLYDKLFRKSMEIGVNLFEKMGSYFAVFDEAEVNGKMEYANHSLYHVNKKQTECVEKYKNDPAYGVQAGDFGDEQFRQDLIFSVSNIKHKFVGPYTEKLQTEAQYVPYISKYDLETDRDLWYSLDEEYYGENGELWAYHCMGPLAPHPTVHMEDEVLGTRVMGWIMNEYNIVGSLYWDVTLYAWREDNWTNLQLTDYYSTALRFPTANGDGFLLYPGAPYGIYGPVASMRLASLRDAFEDYDLLYALEELYKENGLTETHFNNAVSILNARLYNGTKIKHGIEQVDVFDEVRDTLAELLILAKEGVFITDITEKNSKTTFILQAPKNVKIFDAGTALNGVVEGENAIYTVEVNRVNTRNELNLSFDISNETLYLNVYVGGVQRVVSADSYDITIKSKLNEYTKENVTIDDASAIRIHSNALTEGNRNGEYLNIDLSNFTINEKTRNLLMYVYNHSGGMREMDVYFKSEDSSVVQKFATYKLQEGLNIVSIDVSLLVKSKVLSDMRLLFSSTDVLDVSFREFVVSE